jgi:hypothetical protein
MSESAVTSGGVPAGLPGDAPLAAARGDAGFRHDRAGRPALDFIIIDDPLKPEEALSQAQRQPTSRSFTR